MTPAKPNRSGARAPTSAEVARLAGVSRTTVSFVLNGVGDQGISPATRERVQAAARELGYEPNAAARSLVGGATDTLALVLPSIGHLSVDAFLAQVVASVNDHCHAHGLRLLIESTEGEGREPGGFVQLVRSRRIDGLVMVNPRLAEQDHLLRLREQGIPLVCFGHALPDASPLQTVAADGVASARLPVQHLIGLGHQRIALVNFARRDFRAAQDRELGWREALEQAGLAADPALVAEADISADSGWRAMQALLAGGARFSAVFAGNDTIAFGVLKALAEAGLRVPQDVAVVGYDDIPLAAFASPPLTSVRSDPAGLGRQAVELLVAQLRPGRGGTVPGAAPAQPPRLVVRQSCGSGAGRGDRANAS